MRHIGRLNDMLDDNGSSQIVMLCKTKARMVRLQMTDYRALAASSQTYVSFVSGHLLSRECLFPTILAQIVQFFVEDVCGTFHRWQIMC